MAGLRTIRGQLVAGLVLFELLALVFFSTVMFHEVSRETAQRRLRRLEYQASELQVVSTLALRDNDMEMLHTVVGSMLQFPTISAVKVTTGDGVVLAATDATLNGSNGLTAEESALVPEVHSLRVFTRPGGGHEAAMPIWLSGQRVAFLWIYPNEGAARTDFRELLRVSAAGALAVLLACTVLAMLLAASLTRPLTRLLAATRGLIENPEDISAFPLEITSTNEAADLTAAFNLLVASIEEQRTGLNDTLALLDSMLAHAPIGIAFFDREGCFIRVNQYLAENHPQGVAHYLGRRIEDVFSPEAASALMGVVVEVFEDGVSVQGLELAGLGSLSGDGEPAAESPEPHAWLVNAYPVRTAAHSVRWAGVVLIDITERLRTERALRETEKLTVTGRLSASIAHEINNPLEAVTNLLYLIERHGDLSAEVRGWAQAAGHEVARVSEIAQQTLRFYRQSSRREETSLADMLDAVLALHKGRVLTLAVEVVRRYRDSGELCCFGGELRQLFANLVGNALDAMQPWGGRLTVSVRRATGWSGPDTAEDRPSGVRVTVADTGIGMSEAVRRRIFEPFFTTKEATGTGLGLWVSAEIMAKHSVAVRIRSREGSEGRPSGTVFHLFFPDPPGTVRGVLAAVEAQSAV